MIRLATLPAFATLLLAPAAHALDQTDRSLQAFETALAAQDSATTTLTEWCALHDIAEPAQITARPASDTIDLPTGLLDDIGDILQAEPEELAHRHVLLSCGDVVLSDAHNWYVPARLTEAANYLLDETETPFGRAVGADNFVRVRLAEQQGAVDGCPPGSVLSHAAVLLRTDGLPISMVLECYTSANLEDQAR